jgi:hypothetical protein
LQPRIPGHLLRLPCTTDLLLALCRDALIASADSVPVRRLRRRASLKRKAWPAPISPPAREWPFLLLCTFISPKIGLWLLFGVWFVVARLVLCSLFRRRPCCSFIHPAVPNQSALAHLICDFCAQHGRAGLPVERHEPRYRHHVNGTLPPAVFLFITKRASLNLRICGRIPTSPSCSAVLDVISAGDARFRGSAQAAAD